MCQVFNCIGIGNFFHFHDEFYDVSAFVATKAIEKVFIRLNMERCGLFAMKRAAAPPFRALGFKFCIFADYGNHVCLYLNFVYGFFGNQSRHRSSLSNLFLCRSGKAFINMVRKIRGENVLAAFCVYEPEIQVLCLCRIQSSS